MNYNPKMAFVNKLSSHELISDLHETHKPSIDALLPPKALTSESSYVKKLMATLSKELLFFFDRHLGINLVKEEPLELHLDKIEVFIDKLATSEHVSLEGMYEDTFTYFIRTEKSYKMYHWHFVIFMLHLYYTEMEIRSINFKGCRIGTGLVKELAEYFKEKGVACSLMFLDLSENNIPQNDVVHNFLSDVRRYNVSLLDVRIYESTTVFATTDADRAEFLVSGLYDDKIEDIEGLMTRFNYELKKRNMGYQSVLVGGKYLRLHNSLSRTLMSSILLDCTHVNRLTLESVIITEIMHLIWSPHLVYLDISNCGLDHIPLDIAECRSLRVLIISHNPISNLDKLVSIPIEEIDISYTKVTNIPRILVKERPLKKLYAEGIKTPHKVLKKSNWREVEKKNPGTGLLSLLREHFERIYLYKN